MDRHLTQISEIRDDDLKALVANASAILRDNGLRPKSNGHDFSQRWVAILSWPHRIDGEEGNLQYLEDIAAVSALEKAAKRLGFLTVIAQPDNEELVSDVVRSVEILLNTSRTSEDHGRGCIIVRHHNPAIVSTVASSSAVVQNDICVVNGGYGFDEDPISGLAHLTQIASACPALVDFPILLIGDGALSPAQRSLTVGLSKLGAELHFLSISRPQFRLPVATIQHSDFSQVPLPLSMVILFATNDLDQSSIEALRILLANSRPQIFNCSKQNNERIDQILNQFNVLMPTETAYKASAESVIGSCILRNYNLFE